MLLPQLEVTRNTLTLGLTVALFAICTVSGGLLSLAESASFHSTFALAVSAFTSTGMSVADFSNYSFFSRLIILALMEIGGTWSTSLIAVAIMGVRGEAVEAATAKAFVKTARRREHHTASSDVLAEAASERRDENSSAAKRLRNRERHRFLIKCCLAYSAVGHAVAFLVFLIAGNNIIDAVFNGVSAFHNVGFLAQSWHLNDVDQTSKLLLLPLSLSMIAGCSLCSTFFRAFARGLRYLSTTSLGLRLVSPHTVELLDYVMMEEKRIHPLVFSGEETGPIVAVWLGITVIQCALFLPYYSPTSPIFSGSVPGQVLEGFFQSVALRTSGYAIVDITAVRTGQLALWMLVMLITVYPLLLTSESSNASNSSSDQNLKDTRGAGVTEASFLAPSAVPLPATPSSSSASLSTVSGVVAGFHGAQQAIVSALPDDGRLSKLIARDLFTLYMAVVLVCFIEDRQLTSRDDSFFIRLCFEIVSAFGTVGLSLPTVASASLCFSANLKPISRMVIWIAMIFGKIRGWTPEMDFVLDFREQVTEEASQELLAANALVLSSMESQPHDDACRERIQETLPKSSPLTTTSSCGGEGTA
jgi:Trk-type K+ transport system membrane component